MLFLYLHAMYVSVVAIALCFHQYAMYVSIAAIALCFHYIHNVRFGCSYRSLISGIDLCAHHARNDS